jgi:hypothetical protein
MTHIIEQQNLYLQTTKQRIVQNLNDIDGEINLDTNDDVDMEGSGNTIREFFFEATHYSTAWNIQTPLMSTGSCLMKQTRSKLTHCSPLLMSNSMHWETRTMQIQISDSTFMKK